MEILSTAMTSEPLWRLMLRRSLAGLVDGALVALPSAGVLAGLFFLYEPEGKGMEALGVTLAGYFLSVALLLTVPAVGAALFANRYSPGRRLAHLEVVRAQGNQVPPWTAAARIFVPVLVVMLPYGWIAVAVATVISLAWRRELWWDLLTNTHVVPAATRISSAVPPPPVSQGLRVALGWLVAVPWLLFAAVVGFARGDWGALLLLSLAAAALLWWAWPRARRWVAPVLFLLLTVLALSPAMVAHAPRGEDWPWQKEPESTAIAGVPRLPDSVPFAIRDRGREVAAYLESSQRLHDPRGREKPGALDYHGSGRIDRKATVFTPLAQLREAMPEWTFTLYDVEGDLVADYLEVDIPDVGQQCITFPVDPDVDQFAPQTGPCPVPPDLSPVSIPSPVPDRRDRFEPSR